MKYKALAISFLLLLSIIAYIPLATRANQPPPQTWRVELSVQPALTNFTAPCKVSTMFPIDVWLWNYMNASGVHGGTGVGVYAFDFILSYDNVSGISLVNVATHIPWPEGKYFIIANKSVVVDSTHLGWHLAVTAYGNTTEDPSLELTEIYASLLTLTFHVDDEPCWPNVWTTDFTIRDYKLSSDGEGATPIDNPEIDNGVYIIYSSQPDITLSPATVNGKCVSRNFTLTVSLSNAEKVYGFEFDLSWNATYLESNIQCLTIGSLFPPPYETLVEQIDNTAGTAHVVVVRPCEKAPVTAHEDITAATLCFHDIFVQPNPLNPIIQYPYNSSISITHALIYAKCPAPVTYTSTATTSTYAGVFTGTGPQSGVLASETYAKATDDGKYLYLTVGLTNPIDYVWFSGGVEALITYGTTNIGVLFDPSLHYFAYPYAYYNGTTWNNASDVATHFNFTVSGSQALGYYTFKIPFANLPNYLGQTISSTLYWWDGSFANYMWSTTAFSYNRQLLVKVNPAVKYIWTPNIYDLNLDCNVDMGDLSALLKVYGSTTSNWAALVASNPTIVDIYDFVIVAKHVGIDP